jgi:hypothetical protein
MAKIAAVATLIFSRLDMMFTLSSGYTHFNGDDPKVAIQWPACRQSSHRFQLKIPRLSAEGY